MSERPSPLSLSRPPPNRTYEGQGRQRGIERGRKGEEDQEEGRAKKGDEVACRDRVAMTTLLEMSRASRERGKDKEEDISTQVTATKSVGRPSVSHTKVTM